MEPSLFAALDESTRQRVHDVAARRRYRRGEVIFHAGDAANAMHVIVSGHVSVQVTTWSGELAILTVLGPRSSFGEIALLRDDAERSAGVSALDAVETWMIGKADFVRLRATNPAMDRWLVGQLSRYIRRQDARVVEALYVPADKRVLRRVLAMGRLYGDGSPGTIVPLTQDVFANMAGTTRPTTNQVLRAAERDGLLTVARGQVTLVDPAGLGRRAR